MSKRRVKHAQDVLEEAIATASAAHRMREWLENDDNRMALEALLLTFDDDDAEALLGILRGKFWGEP